mmetsp:Transcript_47887/g.95233  ORF Transcript_47887/g.95233 Transcript_47887/m.95233 type:complete len:479 (-) Transcript_47887:236-1672(-)
MVSFFKKKATGPDTPKKPTKEEEAALKKEKAEQARLEKEEKAAERNEKMLPWSLEQKVAMGLNPIKIPILIVVAILGSWVELSLVATKHETWVAGVWRGGPTCYVNELDGPLLNSTRLDWLSDWLNETMYPFINAINKSLENSSNVTENGNRRVYFWESKTFLHFPIDHCGITDNCSVEDDPGDEMYPVGSEPYGLAYWRIPYVTYSLLWAVYKFVFLPFHPVDRFYRMVSGKASEHPEPVFKLLTEPYFSSKLCGGDGGKVNKGLNIVSMVGKIIRYSLLPNSLLLPVITLRSRRECPHLIAYTMDSKMGGIIYFWILTDLVTVFAVYVLGIAKGGKCIATCFYRAYKFIWFSGLGIALTLFIIDFILVFNWNFLAGLRLQLRLFFTIVLSPNLTINFLQVLGFASIFFDSLQFTIMVMSFLCPHLLKRVPGMAGLLKDDAAPSNNKPDPEHADGEVGESGEASEALLTAKSGRSAK